MLEGTIQTGERPEVVGGRAMGSAPDQHDLLARLSAMSLAGLGQRLHVDRRSETEATAVARAWLDLVDSGLPDLSWGAVIVRPPDSVPHYRCQPLDPQTPE